MGGCLASPRRALPLLPRSYGLIRQSHLLVPPRFVSLERSVFAGCCQPLPGTGPARRYLCEAFGGCLDPYPGGPRGARARFFPRGIGLPLVRTGSALHETPYGDFSTGFDFGAAVIRAWFKSGGFRVTLTDPHRS